ncbi:hypothetical protein ACQPXS_46670 (plasmid) [Streptomyces sp. CA-142005]|uniref:hypothetical protein n=1 Tax=Streptomyces sp. CA-142005 TaxID=3240052 RepID=UPI003D8F4ECC
MSDKRRFKRVGAIASLALVMAAGVVSPAMAEPTVTDVQRGHLSGCTQGEPPAAAGRAQYGGDHSCGLEINAVSNTTNVAPGEPTNVTAQCPAGQTAISGGFEAPGFQGGFQAFRQDTTDTPGDTWRLTVINTGPNPVPFTVFAYCVDGDHDKS